MPTLVFIVTELPGGQSHRALNSKIKTWDRSLRAIGGPQKSLSRGITGNEPGRLEGGERNGGRAYSGRKEDSLCPACHGENLEPASWSKLTLWL